MPMHRTNIYLSDEEKAAIETIKRRHPLGSDSEVIRMAIREFARAVSSRTREQREPAGRQVVAD
jgi:Arc/MetJ-type ribon-helix-helix transcriptional regulator